MKHPFRTTRHGLTRCAACGVHVRVELNKSGSAECEFCGEPVSVRTSPSRRRGRSGTIAGALLAFSAAACGGAETPQPEQPPIVETDPEDDNTAVAMYGMPAEEEPIAEEETEPAPDTPAVALYGMPPQ